MIYNVLWENEDRHTYHCLCNMALSHFREYMYKEKDMLICLFPRSTGRGHTVLPLSFPSSVCSSFRLSVPLSIRSKIFFVALFSATIDGRNPIFGHKLHIGMPYCGKRVLDSSDSYFLFADLVGVYAHWTYIRGNHKWQLAHSSSCLTLRYSWLSDCNV